MEQTLVQIDESKKDLLSQLNISTSRRKELEFYCVNLSDKIQSEELTIGKALEKASQEITILNELLLVSYLLIDFHRRLITNQISRLKEQSKRIDEINSEFPLENFMLSLK